LILEGLGKKRQIIEQQRAETCQKQLAEVRRISDLDRAEKRIQEQVEKLNPAPRDDSHLELPSDGLPTREQCGHTVKGNMYRPPRRATNKSWDIFGDRGRY